MDSENPISQNPAAPDTNQNPADNGPKIQSSLSQTGAKMNLPPSHADYKITCDKKRDGWDYTKIVAEFVGLGFLIAYTIFAGLQWCASKKANGLTQQALDTGKENFVKDERPYIWLGNNLGTPEFLRPPGSTSPDGYVAWAWHYTNYGKTPARDVRLNQGMRIGDNALAKARTFDGPELALPPLPPTKDDFSSSIFKQKVSPNEFQRLMNTEETVVIYGRFTYTDASGSPYETEFCIYHLKSGPIAYCPDPGSNHIR